MIELLAAYRPLYVLDIGGKMYERLSRGGLSDTIRAERDLSLCHFNFRVGRGVIDVVHPAEVYSCLS